MRGYASGGLVGGSAAASGIGGINVYAPVSVTTAQSNDTKQQQSGDGALAQAYQKVVDRSVREASRAKQGLGESSGMPLNRGK
jgi:phage-related minor tail protein